MEHTKKLINLAHKDITRKKGKDYSPNVHEIQKWIDEYIKKGKSEEKTTNEMTGADSSGSFETNAFSNVILKKDIHKLHNFNESLESTAVGQYDVALFGGIKGRKNPLKINGPESIKNSRAVKDKNFPKWGGPGGIFIKIKEKCKKFPYCNQGDINAIEILKEAIDETSKKLGIPRDKIENIVLNEINKIFI